MTLGNKAALVHIGLPKTATTSMQNRWRNDPNIALVHQGLLPAVGKAREIGRNRSGGNTPIKWQFDTQPLPGQKIVFSQEALSSAYINERATVDDIQRFQQAAADTIKELMPDSRILIVLRTPDGWIKSIYNQAVKQGGIDSFVQFLVNEREYIEQSLNIVQLKRIWARCYGKKKVLVLPMELFRDNVKKFYECIENFCEISSPDLNVHPTSNPSLSPDKLRMMRYFNKWVNMFRDYGLYAKQMPPQIKQALDIIRFAVRYNLESPPPELNRRLRFFEKNLQDCQVGVSLENSALLQKVKKRNAEFLKDNDFFGYKTLYV